MTKRTDSRWVFLAGFAWAWLWSSAAVASETAPIAATTCSATEDDHTLRLGLVGDIYLSRRAEDRLQSGLPRSQLQDTLAFLNAQTDILVGNLEGALTERTERAFPDQPFALRMRPRLATVLRSWGLDGVTLANNHTMDFGLAGLVDTKKALAAANIKHAGAGETLGAALEPMIFEEKGFKVHVLSFNATFPEGAWATNERPGVAYPELSRLKRLVASSSKVADMVVVAVHWGAEGQLTLRDYQPLIADAAIEAGATLVYGHHTHSVQPIHRKGSATVAYGLGNFVFDSYSRTAQFGLALIATICRDQRATKAIASTSLGRPSMRVQLVPLNTNNFANHFGTRIMTPREAAEASQGLKESDHWPPDIEFLLPQASNGPTVPHPAP